MGYIRRVSALNGKVPVNNKRFIFHLIRQYHWLSTIKMEGSSRTKAKSVSGALLVVFVSVVAFTLLIFMIDDAEGEKQQHST